MNRKSFLRRVVVCTAALAPFAFLPAVASDTAGSRDEAQAMVRRAAVYVKEKGPEAAYAEFIDGTKFKDRDLYISVYDFQGNCLAHGANPKLVGKNLYELKDVNGVQMIKTQIDIARTKGEGWIDSFTWMNPVTKKMQEKSAFVQRVGDTYIGVGYYK